MSSLEPRHPSEEELLSYADGELPARQAERVRAHLAACWQCRATHEEIQRTITTCVRYRKAVESCFPSPPAPWCDIRRRMEQADAAPGSSSFGWREAVRAWVQPRRWLPAAAAFALVALMTGRLRVTPSAEAAQLLRKAAAAEQTRPNVPRRIEIRTGSLRIGRVSGVDTATAAKSGEQLVRIAALFRAANYSWEDPLSARAFAAWRDQLPQKWDEVQKIEDPQQPENACYQIRTKAAAGTLLEATLKLRRHDLRPVEGTWQFRQQQLIEIVELPAAAPMESEPLASPTLARAPAVEARSRSGDLVATPTPADELLVFARLHRIGADLGEPVEVERTREEIRLTGIGLSAGIRRRIEQEVGSLPFVRLEFVDPEPVTPPPDAGPDTGRVSSKGRNGQLLQQVEKALGGRTSFEEFADDVLGTADALMARAHALRRLAARFPVDIERQLPAENRRLLEDQVDAHAEALAQLSLRMKARLEPVLTAFGAAQQTEAPLEASALEAQHWQAAAESLFALCRTAEKLSAALAGGWEESEPAGGTPAALHACLNRLNTQARACKKLVRTPK